MSFEKLPQLSADQEKWLEEVAEKIIAGEKYPSALRQVLANNRMTHEPDIQRLMSLLSSHIDGAVARTKTKHEERADVEMEIAALKEAQLQADLEQVKQDRGGDPED